jgi:hypothetical protein
MPLLYFFMHFVHICQVPNLPTPVTGVPSSTMLFTRFYVLLNSLQMLRFIASECSQSAHWLRPRSLHSPSIGFFTFLFRDSLSSLFSPSPKFKTIAVSPTSAWPSICVSIACKLRYFMGKSISGCHLTRLYSPLTLFTSPG